jgi:hypothetical protein
MNSYEQDDNRQQEESNFEEYKYLCSVEAFSTWLLSKYTLQSTSFETELLEYKKAAGLPDDAVLHNN